MAQCPNCHSQIEIGSEYFGGLFTCPQCQSVYFISFDGVPEGASSEAQVLPDPIADPVPDYSSSVQTDYNINEASAPEPEPQVYETSVSETPQASTDPLQEIVDFGNSEAVATSITYSLHLKGIDLIQNIEDLKSVFSDSKLEMNFDLLKSKIRNGELFIEKLEPGKAAVIAQRLRALSLTMIWEQKIYE